MTVYYLDTDYRLYTEQDAEESFLLWEDTEDMFDDKCRAFIEGYRVVPEGETWTRSDGEAFDGLMITPAVDFDVLLAAQSAYEQANAEAAQEADTIGEMDEGGDT